ncbi:FAD-binding oxidoreductase [Roseobacter sp.]|uniref:NAD(P)/FAD-dependent oxidoreductase n=1 Tax=Roseobacter sp. TaxID=1907202 RepID=UPI0032994B3A
MSHAALDHTKPPHVVVVGGGMVGIATALWSQREGCKVTLVDKGGPEDRASFGNAGVLASASVLPVTMPGLIGKLPKMVLSRKEPIYLRWPYVPRMLPWGVRYLAHATEPETRRIAAALQPIIGNSLQDHLALSQGTAAQRHITPCDFAVLYGDRAGYEKDQLGWQIRGQLGFEWTEHDGPARHDYDPIFAKSYSFLAALTEHGQIGDPGAYVEDLRAHFTAAGGRIVAAEVTDIMHDGGRATGVMTATGPMPADRVAITAGAWSPLLTGKLGVKIPVEAESGYHLEFWDPSFYPRVPTIVPSKKLIFSPMNGRIRAAGGVEFGGLKNTGQDQAFECIRAALHDVLPGLKYSKETQWFGHRPATTDSVPVIDEMPHIKGLFLGFGHQHVGLTGSARTGQILAQLISGKRPNIDLSPYSATRFMAARHRTQHREGTSV